MILASHCRYLLLFPDPFGTTYRPFKIIGIVQVQDEVHLPWLACRVQISANKV
jgi:hypothetical protein